MIEPKLTFFKMQVEGASVDSADALLEKVNIIVRCATPQFNAGLLSATATELLCSGNWSLLDEIINTTTTAAATTSPQKEQQKQQGHDYQPRQYHYLYCSLTEIPQQEQEQPLWSE